MGSYETVQGDTWDMIAKKVYGNEKYADFLMANNWHVLEYMIFPSGISLAVPELTEDIDLGLPIWRD